EDRPNAGQFVILSYGLWSRRFGGDPQVVGTTLELGDGPYRVVGILGPGFDTEQFPEQPEIWLPFQVGPDTADGGSICQVTARLRPGVTLGMANAALQLAAAEYHRRFPDSNPKYAVVPLQDAVAGPDVRSWLELLAGAVGLVLLIACGNVANLSIARALSRRREIAIRAAVGGRRGRISLQLLTESAVLSVLGSSLGLGIGLAAPRAILALYPANSPLDIGFNPINLPRLGNHGSAIALDWRVAAFAAGLSVLTTILSGLLPAFRVGRADLNLVLRESGASSVAGARMRSLLVIGQIAVTVILLVGAALLIRTSAALAAVNPGFDAGNILTIQLPLTGTRFERASERNRLVRDGVQRLRDLPGVASAGVSCCLPLELVWQFPFIIPGRPLAGPFHGFAGWTPVSPGYFEVFRIPLLRGRGFTARDDAAAPPVVIINEAMARRGWPGNPPERDPLQEHLVLGKSFGPPYDRDPARQIVGIVADVRDTALNRNPRPIVYVPFAQVPDGIAAATLRLQPLAWIVRTRVEPHALGPSIRDQLRRASGGLPAGRVRTMGEVEARSTARTRFETLLLNIFAASALLLAMIGIYGLNAYAIRQRTREIGIRLALGAKPSRLRNWILLQGMRLVLAGAAAGLLLAFACSRLLAGFLFGVKPWDPAVFTITPALLAVVAAIAVWVPARRATRVDPQRVLRCD
ncbi:MAG TPA: ADOP family duplicated permease, partial [Bryobacteraceae bacterium]|nr:ADOP family duplicated permease [Bryobacteraceae bacterium]